MAKSKKNKTKAKLNLTVRDEQRNKLEQMASLENRSLSNLIEVMADERWKRLAEQQGVAYAKTEAEAMNPKVDMDNPADREKLRRAVLDLVAGRKTPNRRRKRHVMMNVKATESMLPPFIITGTQFRPLKVWPCGATRSQVKEAHLGITRAATLLLPPPKWQKNEA